MQTIQLQVSNIDPMMMGYEQKTTFWMDFSIADKFGIAAIKDTYKRAFNAWKGNHVYLTELLWYSITKFGSGTRRMKPLQECTTHFGRKPTYGHKRTSKAKSLNTSTK